MIKHAFCINQWGLPDFRIEDKYWMLMDLATRDVEKVRKIIKDLESVINGEVETVEIEGYDITIVDCSKDGCEIYYSEETTIGPLPVIWFLDLYKDWLEFLITLEEHKKKDIN